MTNIEEICTAIPEESPDTFADSPEGYQPPRLSEKTYSDYSSETLLRLSMESPSAGFIDEVISEQRDPEAAETQTALAIISGVSEKLAQRKELEAKSEDKEVENPEANAAITSLNTMTENGDNPDDGLLAELIEISKQLELNTADLEKITQQLTVIERNIDAQIGTGDIYYKQGAEDTLTSTMDKAHFKLSSGYRQEIISQYREKLNQSLREKKEAVQQSAKKCAENNNALLLSVEEKIFNGSSLDDVERYVGILDEERKKLSSAYKELPGTSSDKALELALEIDRIDITIGKMNDFLQKNYEALKTQELQKAISPNSNDRIRKLLITLSDIARNPGSELPDARKAFIKSLSEEFAMTLYTKVYDKSAVNLEQGKVRVQGVKSAELAFVPTTEELQRIKELIEAGMEIDVEDMGRGRERVELLSRAESSFVTHSTHVYNAVRIIESGGIMPGGMAARKAGKEPDAYGNSPVGNNHALEQESYFTLNDAETTYLRNRFRANDEQSGTVMLPNNGESYGVIFTANLGEQGSKFPWYLQQNSQGKVGGAEEVVFVLEDQMPIDSMYLLVSDSPEVVAFYREKLLASGKTEEWIGKHLIPTGCAKSLGFNPRKLIDVCRAEDIIGKETTTYTAKKKNEIARATHGGTVATYMLEPRTN